MSRQITGSCRFTLSFRYVHFKIANKIFDLATTSDDINTYAILANEQGILPLASRFKVDVDYLKDLIKDRSVLQFFSEIAEVTHLVNVVHGPINTSRLLVFGIMNLSWGSLTKLTRQLPSVSSPWLLLKPLEAIITLGKAIAPDVSHAVKLNVVPEGSLIRAFDLKFFVHCSS